MHRVVLIAVLVTVGIAVVAVAAPVPAPFKVTYDREHLDLERRVLQFKTSTVAASATLVAVGEDGRELGTGAASYQRARPDTWLEITWSQPANTRALKLKLRVVAANGLATNVELIPWSVEIDHDDVEFATDSARIEVSEQSKLDASLVKINEIAKRSAQFMKMKLYVAGHTDTVGAPARNLRLSRARARAIAGYLRSKGLTMPIEFAGFGEQVLEVKTADETDERANRRADYVLGPASAPPPFGGPYLRVKAQWARIQ